MDEDAAPLTAPNDPGGARPRGIPLGRAFIIRPSPFNEDLIAAVRAVASVHGDGPLPAIPVEFAALRGAIGRFWYDRDGRPISISIVPSTPHVGFALVHEIGHFLDLVGIGEPGIFASETAADLAPWRVAVERSRRWRELGQAIEPVVRFVPPDEASTLLEYRALPELWARSYAQFVTERSGDPALRASLTAHRAADAAATRQISRLLHWDDDDFAPIAEAIDQLFRRLGWRSGP